MNERSYKREQMELTKDERIEMLNYELINIKQKLFWRWVFFLYGAGFGAGIVGILWFWHWVISI